MYEGSTAFHSYIMLSLDTSEFVSDIKKKVIGRGGEVRSLKFFEHRSAFLYGLSNSV